MDYGHGGVCKLNNLNISIYYLRIIQGSCGILNQSSIQVLSDMVYANHPHPTTTNAHPGKLIQAQLQASL